LFYGLNQWENWWRRHKLVLERIHRDIREKVKREMGMILLVDRHFGEQKNWNVKVIIKRNALIETLGVYTQSMQQPSQSYQQSVTMNRLVRSSQSGANSNRRRLGARNDWTPERVFHLT
jgi:hypothetical protein